MSSLDIWPRHPRVLFKDEAATSLLPHFREAAHCLRGHTSFPFLSLSKQQRERRMVSAEWPFPPPQTCPTQYPLTQVWPSTALPVAIILSPFSLNLTSLCQWPEQRRDANQHCMPKHRAVGGVLILHYERTKAMTSVGLFVSELLQNIFPAKIGAWAIHIECFKARQKTHGKRQDTSGKRCRALILLATLRTSLALLSFQSNSPFSWKYL